MTEKIIHLALFEEEAIDHAAEAVAQLKSMGVDDHDIAVISGVPFSEKMLGRPMAWTRVGQIGLGGAVVGFLVALALLILPILQYPIRVGEFSFFPIQTYFVVLFELTMLGLLISTFLGVFTETISPSYGPAGYHPEVTDGKIGVLFSCPEELDPNMHAALTRLGAEIVHRPEEKKLWL